VQDNNMVFIANLVDEMGRPKDAYPFVSDKGPYDREDASPRLDVESRRRLIKQQHARLVQERPRDLDASHLTAGKEAHLVARPISETDAGELDCSSLPSLAGADAVQSAMVSKVLRDAKVGIERALLKDYPELSESRAAVARDVAAENAHDSRPAHIKMRDHRE
jgi:hypothetical protein